MTLTLNEVDFLVQRNFDNGVSFSINNSNRPAQAEDLLTADLDGNRQADIIIDFGSAGLWAWANNSSWLQLHARSPEGLVAGELDYLEGFTPTQLSPVDAVIPQNHAPACPAHPTRGQGFEIRFDWTNATAPHGVVGYDLFVMRRGTPNPLISMCVPGSSHLFLNCNNWVADANLQDWFWRVRAGDAQGNVSPWTPEAEFEFQPCRLSDGTPCRT